MVLQEADLCWGDVASYVMQQCDRKYFVFSFGFRKILLCCHVRARLLFIGLCACFVATRSFIATRVYSINYSIS